MKIIIIYNDIIDIDNEVKYWLDLQFSRTFYVSEFMFSRNNPDPPTLTSRIYELLRFSDERIFNYEISLNERMWKNLIMINSYHNHSV